MSASNNKNCSYINTNQKISIVFDGKKYAMNLILKLIFREVAATVSNTLYTVYMLFQQDYKLAVQSRMYERQLRRCG